MSGQGTFFDLHNNEVKPDSTATVASSNPPIARSTDKETSHEGAEHVRPLLKSAQSEFIRRLRLLGGSATANEVARGNETVRKRAKELVELGYVRELPKRPCERTKRNATVYEIVK